jgi:hypothetical protein
MSTCADAYDCAASLPASPGAAFAVVLVLFVVVMLTAR